MASDGDAPPTRTHHGPARRRGVLGFLLGIAAAALVWWVRGLVLDLDLGVVGAAMVVVLLGLVIGVAVTYLAPQREGILHRVRGERDLDADAATDTEDEIKELLREGHIRGEFEKQERELIESVFKFTDTEVRQVMVPRPNMMAVDVESDRDGVLKVAEGNKFSRYPVYRGSVNDIVGFLYYKDLVPVVEGKQAFDMRALMRPPFFVPETMRLGTLLRELQRRHLGMAVVVNEHGNVEGLVTLEDILEEIVGEIHDEYDVEERPVERLRDGSWLVDGSVVIDDLPPELAAIIPSGEGYDTVAGFALSTLQRLPRSGETWRAGACRFTVVEMDGRRIARLKVRPAAQA